MATNLFDKILQEREIKNEKRVAYIRFALGMTIILEILSYFDIIDMGQNPTTQTYIISVFLFFYSLFVLVIVSRNYYLKYLKFFVIFLDYMYIVLSFIFDSSLIEVRSIIVWLAFTASILFYLINLLRYSREGTIFAGILSVLVYIGICFYFNIETATTVNLVIPLVLIIYIGYSITASNKKMMVEANTKKMMERYLPPQLIEELYKPNVIHKPGGIKQEVTILFSDIRSFTSISESLNAEEIVVFLNKYLSEMTDIIFQNRGTIDKFIGDSIMTIFGAPIQQEDDALRAVLTAVQMKTALVNFNENTNLLDRYLEIGIGIHTGEVVAGNIGSEKRLDYTVIGDNVNLSSRIEGLTKYYGCSILISQFTFDKLPQESIENSFCIREIDNVIVKGKSESIRIFEVQNFETEQEREELIKIKKVFEKGLSLYRQRKYKDAFAHFKFLNHDGPSKVYMKRCLYSVKNPPDSNWNGTHVMVAK